MPPKATSRSRNSQGQAPELISIYEILIDKEQDNAVKNIFKKIELLSKHDLSNVERSYFIFVLKICGLDQLVNKINWKESISSLNELLDEGGEENNKSALENELFLINPKSKFHKQFIDRLGNFLAVTISDELSFLSESNILKTIFEGLLSISKCKLRNIRNCSVVLSGLVLSRLKEYFNELSLKKNKLSKKIFESIEEQYLNQIILPRLKDIDPSIREKAFQILSETICSLNELLNPKKLNKFYIQTLSENKYKVTEACLKSVNKLFELETEKLGKSAHSNLEKFATELIKPLEDLVLLPNNNACLAMNVLHTISTFNPALNSLKPKIIAKVFEIHGFENFQEGLKKAVLIFFKSLFPNTDKEELNEHRQVLLIEITHLLCTITSSKLLSTILREFFHIYPNLFVFEDLFVLLFTEYYHRDGTDIELQESEINVICTIICEFNQFLRQTPTSELRTNEENSYNKNVLNNCKEILIEKIQKHQPLAHLYLRLFSLLYRPLSETLSNYLGIVLDKVLDIMKEEKFLILAGNSLILIQQIVHECAAICNFVFDGHPRIETLLRNFGLSSIGEKDSFNDIEIVKISALTSHFEIPEFLCLPIIRKILSSYNRTFEKVIKLEFLTYAYNSHKWLFASLFDTPSQAKHQEYLEMRNEFFDFLFNGALGGSSEDFIVKIGAFNIICKFLRLVSNSKIADLGVVYFEPNSEQTEMIYNFIGENIHFLEDNSVGDLSMTLGNMSIESQETKDQILHNLFQVYTDCYKLSLSPQAINFILKLMQTEDPALRQIAKYWENFLLELAKLEISNENNNRFVFWRFYTELIGKFGEEEDEKMNNAITKLVDIYFKKATNKTKPSLANKLMLYIADSLDKAVNGASFSHLSKIKMLLNRTYRRYQKETLHRLLVFFTSKTANIEDKNVNEMSKFLTKISKSGKSNKNNGENEENEDKDDSEGEENDEENENSQPNRDNQNISSKNQGRGDKNIMVEKSNGRNTRNTRSKTKKRVD